MREADGTTFTDIVTPLKDLPAMPPLPPAPARRADGVSADDLEGDGFIAGEDVAVARVVGLIQADAAGEVHTRLDPTVASAPPDAPREVMLFGRVSGAIAITRLP